MTIEEYNWHEDEAPIDVIKEANERAREIISTLRLAIINTSAYDHGNYVRYGMHGDPESAAFKKMFNIKLEFVKYLEKETRLVFANNEHLYDSKRREVEDKMINDLLEFLGRDMNLRGRIPGPVLHRRVHNIVSKLMDRSERLLEDGIMTKGKMLGKPVNLFGSPVFELKSEILY